MLITTASEQKKENEIGTSLRDLLLYLEHAGEEDELSERASEDAPFFLGQISEQAGRLYEKIRGAVDNKEEHFLRRYAIRRIVKRIMWFSDDSKVIAGRLLRELYKSGYLPEDRVSRHTEEDVVHTISAFLALSDEVSDRHGQGEFIFYKTRLLDIIAGAIEDKLYPTYNEESAVRLLARITHERAAVSEFQISKEVLPTLFYIASWRALFAADYDLLLYKLWLTEYPGWDHLDDNSLTLCAHAFPEFLARIDRQIEHQFISRVLPKLHNDSVAILVIYELIKRYGRGIESLAHNKEKLLRESEALVVEKYRKDIRRAGRKSWNAVIYILATKAVLAGAIESMYVSFFKQQINLLVLFVNISFHPFLLYLLTSRLNTPDKKNTERILVTVSDIIYEKELAPIYVRPARFGILTDIALALYLALLTAMLYVISWTLSFFDFHIVDIVFFLLFFALILYFAFRIRHGATRMQLSGGREGFLYSLLELCALPVVSIGRFLVVHFKRLNVIAVFMDFFIELPFKLILEFFDTFSLVLKEKKDEMYS